MKPKKAYAVVNKRGNLIIGSMQLPIFWALKPAQRYADKFGASVVAVTVNRDATKREKSLT